MNSKEEVIQMILDSIPGSFESVTNKELRIPMTNGKEVKLVVTVAKEALGQKPEFSLTPTDDEMDQLAFLLNALQI